ncbi:MAG TPA: RagB/SusD family nutrient uptake outer membrane protein, partial [Phnomibacter sp.]|nr:RagB/SusD family nutrient uptake outer membrane protein [Phnomibacter sp.]
MKVMHKVFYVTLILSLSYLQGCRKGFLDTVPDNITTLEDVFNSRAMSEQWLARIYSAVPDPWQTPYTTQWDGMTDDMDYTWISLAMNNGALVPDNTAGYWQGYYQAIRYAAIFLANIDKNKEILNQSNGAQIIKQYKGEARFLRAYYYFQLMKIYGPVVLMGEEAGDVNTPYQLPRNTWSECVDYVISEIEKAKLDLPDSHTDPTLTGRIDKGIAMAVQSQVLLYDASPLFN